MPDQIDQTDALVSSNVNETAPTPATPVNPLTGKPWPSFIKTTAAQVKQKEAEIKKNRKALYGSKEECGKPEARRMLELRGITNNHCLDVLIDLGIEAAEQNGISPNRFYWLNGVIQFSKSREAASGQPLPETEEEFIPGELVNRATLYALYDFSIAWREPDLTFEEFFAIRFRCKSDAFYLGKEILNRDFAALHKEWSDFFPKFNPLTLKPDYKQSDAIKWLASQTETRDYILLSSRGAFKSSFSHIWALTLILCQPSARILLVSENKDLALDFVGAIKSYFLRVPGEDSRFQRLFPEYCLNLGYEGSVLTLECPMARLRLPQSVEAVSVSSAIAGRRFDLLLADDILSNKNSSNEEQRQAVIEKYSMLLKLRESGAGLAVVCGTPYHEKDLYSVILARAAESEAAGDCAIKVRQDPCWRLKEGVDPKTPLKDVTEDQVILAFPEKLTFAFLKRELRTDEQAFMSQNLIIFPKSEGADDKVTFDESLVRDHIRPIGAFSDGAHLFTAVVFDEAFSTSGIADLSAIVTTRYLRWKNQDIGIVIDVEAGRWKMSEKISMLLQTCQKHMPAKLVIEKSAATHETLGQGLLRGAMLREFSLPHIVWITPLSGSGTHKSKVSRIKNCETFFQQDRLWIAKDEKFNDIVVDQFLRFNGMRSTGSRKDDVVDAIARACDLLPLSAGDPIKSPEQEELEKAELERSRLRAYTARMFGPDTQYRPPDPEEELETNPLFRGSGAALRRR